MNDDLAVSTTIRADDIKLVLLRTLQLGAEGKHSLAEGSILLHLVLVLDV